MDMGRFLHAGENEPQDDEPMSKQDKKDAQENRGCCLFLFVCTIAVVILLILAKCEVF